MAGAEHRGDRGRGRDLAVGARVHRKRRGLPALEAPRGRRSLGRPDARVGHELAAAAAQLRCAAADPLLRAPARLARRTRGGGRVKRGAIVLLAWGALLGALTVAFAPFASLKGPFGLHAIELIMLGSAAAACVIAGLSLWALDARA